MTIKKRIAATLIISLILAVITSCVSLKATQEGKTSLGNQSPTSQAAIQTGAGGVTGQINPVTQVHYGTTQPSSQPTSRPSTQPVIQTGAGAMVGQVNPVFQYQGPDKVVRYDNSSMSVVIWIAAIMGVVIIACLAILLFFHNRIVIAILNIDKSNS